MSAASDVLPPQEDMTCWLFCMMLRRPRSSTLFPYATLSRSGTQVLSPVGQRGVHEVVGACPHVGECQCPEVNDREAIREDGALGLLRHEVVHHAQEAGSQEEAHGIVPIPPLHHGVLHASIGGVRLPQGDRHLHIVEDMQYRNGDDIGTKEPIGHVNM